MRLSDFNYNLPKELIAQTPLTKRDLSKLLIYDRHNSGVLDKSFYNLPDFLQKGDLLVINNTKVIPARIYGIKRGTGAKIEFLLNKKLSLTDWTVLSKPAKKLREGDFVDFGDKLSAQIICEGESGGKTVRFFFDGVFERVLEHVGVMPLPHYIREKLADSSRYQTIYAKEDGSGAAPTAGLHFTPELMQKLSETGVEIAQVLLHVGLGTFLPVKTDDITEHKMHSEFYNISEEAAKQINLAKAEGRRIIAVGTTSVRVLESVADEHGFVRSCSGETSIFIYPPYKFKTIDGLITNFHLPESTLLMLVSAFIGKDVTMELYNHAIAEKYRFFSFGDAMLLL